MDKKIKLITATVRPAMFASNMNEWKIQCEDWNNVDLTVAVNTLEEKLLIEEMFEEAKVIAIGDNIGVVKPIFEITKTLDIGDDDILLAMFDDVACIKNWDVYIKSQFEDYTGSILLNDGIQDPITRGLIAITMPIMDGRTLKKLNRIIYHPEYMHYYADNEVYSNLLELGLIKDIRRDDVTTFQHLHYYGVNRRKADSIDHEIIAKCGSPDRAIFDKRMKLSVKERLVI